MSHKELEADGLTRQTVKHSQTDTLKKHTTYYAHTHRGRTGEGLGEMKDHLLAVQFILIQSGGRAEQRVNAAHMHILSTPWGRTHRHTLHTYAVDKYAHMHC